MDAAVTPSLNGKSLKTMIDHPSSPKPSRKLQLPQEEVHVWRAALDVDPLTLAELTQSLSPDEQDRAAKFHFAAHANRFRAARGILRRILASYLLISPEEISFSQNDFGKPALSPSGRESDVRFNVAHSQGLALYAFAREREVGVDIEQVNPQQVDLHVAESFFSAREAAEISAAPVDLRPEKFFRCWTRKEAYAKALGMGLSIDLRSFSVPLDPRLYTPMAVGDDAEPKLWWLAALAPAEGYVGAIVTENPVVPLKLWQW